MHDAQYKWVISHIWTRHVTHMNESCHSAEYVTSHWWRSHGIWVAPASCHTHECVMSRIWMSHVSHLGMSQVTIMHESWYLSSTCVMNETRLAHTYTYEGVISRVWTSTSPIWTRHIYVWHYSLIRTYVDESCHIYEWVCLTHINESCHTHTCVTCLMHTHIRE